MRRDSQLVKLDHSLDLVDPAFHFAVKNEPNEQVLDFGHLDVELLSEMASASRCCSSVTGGSPLPRTSAPYACTA